MTTPISVVAGLILRDRQVLMLEKDGYWIFPGGKVEEGESDVLVLLRELYQEISTPWHPDHLDKLRPNEWPRVALHARYIGGGLPGQIIDCRFYLVVAPQSGQIECRLSGEHRGGKHCFVGRQRVSPLTPVSKLCLEQLISQKFVWVPD